MRRIKAGNTGPEMIVRQMAHRLGGRFRLHRRDLPGRPDLAFIGRRKAIFVHGCFWHRHDACKAGHRTPRSRQEYWLPKLRRNVERDADARRELEALGWTVLTIWECETKDRAALERRLRAFLQSG